MDARNAAAGGWRLAAGIGVRFRCPVAPRSQDEGNAAVLSVTRSVSPEVPVAASASANVYGKEPTAATASCRLPPSTASVYRKEPSTPLPDMWHTAAYAPAEPS
ncbi:hypothetical protein P3342_003907 [Pyrenophora teres f. teres]|nr:hypothetical protein PTNB85_00310 [Pyrenophora teres f. teres]KAK1916092.1 hypothetical protein P3342_003907 [Pyrenophora teres f. teres]